MIKHLFLILVSLSLLLSACSPDSPSATEAKQEDGYSVNPNVILNEEQESVVQENNPGEDSPIPGLLAYEDISVETLVDMMMTRRETFLLINTLDFQMANLPDTDLMISYDLILANLDLFPEDKNAEIVLYCRSGNKSSMAAAELAQAGFTNVKNLAGGMLRWHQLGLPLFLPE